LLVELVERIIITTWHMPLSSNERITFMESSMLVNSTWADIFDSISSRDVYIPSSTFCEHFIQRLRAPKSVTPTIRSRSVNLACQSLTIQIVNVAVHPDKHILPMGAVLDKFLESLNGRFLTPNLRHLSIEYVNGGFDNIFHRESLHAFPRQITHLELCYSFRPETPGWFVEALREKEESQRNSGWIFQSVTHLSVKGAGQNTVSDLLRSCPNL
ncbi:hypothetical protein FB451DRAFT_1439534, partial [Mycena latifolia]